MKSSRTGLAFGILAGAALAAFAVTKAGRTSLKKLGDRAAELRDEVTREVKQFKKLKGHGQRFI